MSYKKKNIILLCGSIILLFLSYQLAFKETFAILKKNENLQTQLVDIDNAPKEIKKLENELNLVEGNSKILYSGVLQFRENLLSEMTQLSAKYNINIISFPEYFLDEKAEFALTTSPIILEGEFKNLHQLIDNFERNKSSGKISAANFKLEKMHRSKKKKLLLTLYIQSINI